MSSIGQKPVSKAEVGVATGDGRSYFRMTTLLNKINLPYIDIIIKKSQEIEGGSISTPEELPKNLKLVVTTRKERLLFAGVSVVCIEDLGDDIGIARERLLSYLYPSKEDDLFVVGVDPGERTGLAAFMNHLQVDSFVSVSLDDTIRRVSKLIDNAPQVNKVVKIGFGIPDLAEDIASRLNLKFGPQVRIQLVDERGTSTLNSKTKNSIETRDQRAAKLIAFREGRDYPDSSLFPRTPR